MFRITLSIVSHEPDQIETERKPGEKVIVLHFQLSPKSFQQEDGQLKGVSFSKYITPSLCNAVNCDHTEHSLYACAHPIPRMEMFGDPSHQRSRPLDETVSIDSSLLFRSIGYRRKPFPGLPYDEGKGVVANTDGRVETPKGTAYVVGWAGRGYVVGSGVYPWYSPTLMR